MTVEKQIETSDSILIQRDKNHFWSRITAISGHVISGATSDHAVLLMLIDGCVRVTVEAEERKLCVGAMFLIPHGTPFRGEVVEDTQLLACRFTADMLVNPDYPLDSLMPFCRKGTAPFTAVQMRPLLWNFSSFVHTCLGDGIRSQPFYDRKRLELFDLLFACYDKKELAELLAPVIREGLSFRRFVLDNYIKVKELDELIALSNLSRSGFYRNFALYFAKSPYDWMLEQKAIHIRRDLISGVTPKEITFRYGFSSMSHLNQFCKKQFNMTPTQVAKSDTLQGEISKE